MDQETTLGKFKEAFKEEQDTDDQRVLSMNFSLFYMFWIWVLLTKYKFSG